jgi:hypothetical protein
MSRAATFRLVHDQARALAGSAVRQAPDGYVVTVKPGTRSLDQNAKFHAICEDIARSPIEFGGCRRTAEEWKVLLVSGHATATGRTSELIRGLEGELVQLRESTAAMSKERSSSLIEYTTAWAVSHGVPLREPRDAP